MTSQVMAPFPFPAYGGAMTTSPTRPRSGGLLLREWRERRRLTQLDLANLAGTSSRHLSFVETGRSRPSREMVLRLAEALDVPLAERNQILLASGHAPEYDDARSSPASTRQLLDMLDLVLAAHEPWPALVLDAQFDVVAANRACDRLLALVDPDVLDPPVNVVRATLHPRGLARWITNLPAWRAHLLRQVRRHLAATAGDADLAALLAEAEEYPVKDATSEPMVAPTFALPLELCVEGVQLRLYSTVATFGTPLDVAASELAVETFLPADAATREWLSS
jgi:transcriptional regulator with XRE-family HTH domain